MKLRRNILILTLAVAAVLTGCGDVEDEARVAGTFAEKTLSTSAGDISAADGESSKPEESREAGQENDAQEGNETQTVADPRQAPETEQTTEPPQATETSVQTTEAPELTAVPKDMSEPAGEVLTPENIDGFMFGFELYNDGHKDCWEQRYECAKVMLEAVSKTDPADNWVDLTVTASQLNDKETQGFMTWLKFEEPMSFQVGDTVMSGNTLNMIDYDGSYYCFVGEIEEMRGMIRLDSSYIPRILEAAGCG